MKRFHVHMHVQDLAKNIAFYSAMFQQQPSRSEPDYAKWMLQDPPLNFAISTRGESVGVDHLGIQVDSAEALSSLKDNARQADMALLDEGATTCCYAQSDKYWITDPQGVAWEQFHTLADIPVFSQKNESNQAVGQVKPAQEASNSIAAVPLAGASCCAPRSATSTAKSCC